MIKYLTIILLTFIIGCHTKDNNVVKEDVLDETMSEIKNKINIDTCYPYNVSSYIRVFSYPNRHLWDGKKLKPGVFKFNDELLKNGKLNFDTSKIEEKITLNKSQTNLLFQFLHNKCCGSDIVASCYDPRHLIVFYDKNNKAIEYIEICLSCSNIYTSKKVPEICTCPAKMDSFHTLLKEFGINYYGDFKTENKYIEEQRK